jgi:tyrosyl-tRNA synthetase
LPEDEVRRLESLADSEINEAKKVLADEATRLCRGEAAAAAAAETARRTFEEGGLGEALPTIDVPRARLAEGVPVYELMRQAGLTASHGEARRLIKGGGGRVNDMAIAEETQAVGLDDLNAEGVIKISAGKKRHALVRAV